MKRMLNSKIFYFILGGIFFSTISVYAVTLISSEEISFTSKDSTLNVNTVQEALDELYTRFPYDKYTEKTTITPNKSTQTLLTKDKVLKSDFIVNPIPETYKNLEANTTVTESSLLKGVKAYDKDGTLITGNLSPTCVSGIYNKPANSQINIKLSFTPSVYYFSFYLPSAGKGVVFYNKNTDSNAYLYSGDRNNVVTNNEYLISNNSITSSMPTSTYRYKDSYDLYYIACE